MEDQRVIFCKQYCACLPVASKYLLSQHVAINFPINVYPVGLILRTTPPDHGLINYIDAKTLVGFSLKVYLQENFPALICQIAILADQRQNLDRGGK